MSVEKGQRGEINPTQVLWFHATGRNRRTCAVSRVSGNNLLPAAVSEPAVAICLKSPVLRWFLSIVLRIPTTHDFRVIAARKWARTRTQRKKFPSRTVLNNVYACAKLRRRNPILSLVLIFCSARSTFCLSGLCQEMDLRTRWIHCCREVYVQE